MSASPHSFSTPPRPPDVLAELLHSLSQPLTSLRCSLELSIDEGAEMQQESVAAALQQTDSVIGMIQLMREYLDAEHPGPEIRFTALAPALGSVIEELSSIAAVRGIQLRLVGTCAATVPVPAPRLRLVLQYLLAAMIEAQPTGTKVMLLLGEGPAGAVLRAESIRGSHELGFENPEFGNSEFGNNDQRAASSQKREPARPTSWSTLRRVRLSIATRVLEAAGASLVLGDDSAGFVLRVPQRMLLSAR